MTTKKETSNKLPAVPSGIVTDPISIIAPSEHVAWLQIEGTKIIYATGKLANMYYELVKGIREKEIAPRLVTEELIKLGFNKTRVSEIQRVAGSNDEVFTAYAAKMIGFNKALDMARQDGKELKPSKANLLLTAEGVLNKDESEAGGETETDTTKAPGIAKSDKEKQDLAAKAVFKLAKKNKVWKSADNQWKLVLTKLSKSERIIAEEQGTKGLKT